MVKKLNINCVRCGHGDGQPHLCSSCQWYFVNNYIEKPIYRGDNK